MPHDANGQVVNKGDEVTINFKVLNVFESDEFCNVELKSVLPMPPTNDAFIHLGAVNTKQTVKVSSKV